jgi:Icc protein
MPITLPPISRRSFLSASAAAAASILTGCSHMVRDPRPSDPNRFVLLSDTHIHYDRRWFHDGKVNTWENFEQVSRHILAQATLPSKAFVCGDCVYLQGRYDDYMTLTQAVGPLRQEGIAVHMALGNHDHRENFGSVMPIDSSREESVADRQVMLVATPYANWYLLDSLVVTNQTPGRLGEKQLAWLAGSLDAHADKAAIIMLHHNPDEPTRIPSVTDGKSAADAAMAKVSGLIDTKALLEVILPRKNVKMCIYGHTHVWQHADRDGLHLLNLPPTAWVFSAERPNGYVAATLRADGASFQLHCLKANHPQNGKTLDLKWR